MAPGGASVSAANDIVQLEALSKDGLSWHPCEVSLCSRGQGINVLYGNNMKEMITDKQEISTRIRVRSTPLQGDDCLSIRQGDRVLATESSHVNGVFYEAQVEKAINVRHSKRSHCRCSFTIKWLHHSLSEEALTVPASAIMKLATTSIHLHPTISAFCSMHEPSNALDMDWKNWEMDINVLLEQQIKEISTSTELPRENILKECLSGHTVDVKGKSHGWEIEASLKDPVQAVSFLDRLNGLNGSENKQPMKLEIPPTPSPSTQEEHRGSRLLLNPLAARAALASLRSEFPQSPQFSPQSNEKGDMTGQHSSEDFSLKISATLEGNSPNFKGIVKRLFPTSSPTHKVELSNLSCGSHIDGMKNKNKMDENKTLSANMRLTRSQIQKDNGMHETLQMTNNNVTQSRLTGTSRITRSRVKGIEKTEAKDYKTAGRGHIHHECMESETSTRSAIAPENCLSDNLKAVASPINGQINSQRVTRSRVKGVEKTEVDEYNAAAKDNAYTGCIKPDSSTQDTVLPKYCSLDNQKAVASPLDSETSLLSVKNVNGVLGKDRMFIDADTKKGYLIQNAEKCNNGKRPTQPAASEEDTESNSLQLKTKVRKRNLNVSNVPIKNNEQCAEEDENVNLFTRADTTAKSSEGSHHGTRQKSASSRKQPETRFSPRLRFLPRTRSGKA